MDSYSRILVRATNWVGDAVMSLPALAALRDRFPQAHISVLARPWVAGLYRHEPFADEIIPYPSGQRLDTIRRVRGGGFECAVLLQNAFDAALITRLASIPRRIGYDRDARGWLLTDAIALPRKGSIPPHESFYYLELLRSVGWVNQLPERAVIRLAGAAQARQKGLERFRGESIDAPVIGVSPGAAYGTAKRWLPERFAEAAAQVAQRSGGFVALFGSEGERVLCEAISEAVRKKGVLCRNFAGETPLEEFIERAAVCAVYLTNDSGAMHISSALGVPTVAVFGATNHITTGPTGEHSVVVRQDVDCSPCLLRECPIDHRCMTAVPAERVAETALDLLQRSGSGYAH